MGTIENLTVAVARLENENNTLRGLLAQGQGDCVYCSLPAADIAKCSSGFPGCARMDDIVNAPETDKDRDILDLRMRLLSARLEVEAVLDAIPNAVRVREGGGDEDVYASLAVSVANLQSYLRTLQHNIIVRGG